MEEKNIRLITILNPAMRRTETWWEERKQLQPEETSSIAFLFPFFSNSVSYQMSFHLHNMNTFVVLIFEKLSLEYLHIYRFFKRAIMYTTDNKKPIITLKNGVSSGHCPLIKTRTDKTMSNAIQHWGRKANTVKVPSIQEEKVCPVN